MEFSNDGPNPRAQSDPTTGEQEIRPSVEVRPPQGPRLQKKRSNAGPRPAGRRPQTYAPTSTIAGREGNKARKGSIRSVLRRVFGRRSREVGAQPEPETVPWSSPGHGHHKSEPSALAPQPELPERDIEEENLSPRTMSVQVGPIPASAQRMRSPYAVEFPHSARLKPMDLGSPFTAPGSTLRRRKTLPSILASDSEAAIVQAAIRPHEDSPAATAGPSRRAPSTEIPRNKRTSRSDKRKSRSADDLVGSSRLSRKRSEEIKFWRESIQGTVLRASGFRVPSPDIGEIEDREDDQTPLARMDDPFVSLGESSGLSPLMRPPQDVSPSALGTELSQDLEDRVAKLEAGLRNFRGELAQMAADRNRRTILIGGGSGPSIRPRRASSGGRTASMLAETLASDLEPSSYQYDYSSAMRPSTSPEPPRTPTRFADPSAAVPAMPVYQRTSEEHYRTPSPPMSPPAASPAGNGNGSTRNQLPQYTFRSLYEMLADERSARRRLETQMRGLRDEISNLNYQVSLQSNVQSQRSSYYAQGSSRLHALLRDTEDSRPSTGVAQTGAETTSLSAEQQRIVSRFSGSESEAETGELQTPYEAYQTPLEEQGRFPFNEPRSSEGDMF